MPKLMVVFILFISFSWVTKAYSQSTESLLKAVALEKVSLFISWPNETAGIDSNQEFEIAVLNQNDFAKLLSDVYKDKNIKNREVRVFQIKDINELSTADLLFIPKIPKKELVQVLNYLDDKPILTISDTEGFAEAGCFVNFYLYENKLRFEINHKGLYDAGFSADYRLLRVSKIINPIVE